MLNENGENRKWRHTVNMTYLQAHSAMYQQCQQTNKKQLKFYFKWNSMLGIQAYTLTFQSCSVSLVCLKNSGTNMYHNRFLLYSS
jgi:hypothetical protein